MRSATVKVQTEKNAYNIKQYLPPLREAPDLTKHVVLPVQMPKLVAAPKFGKLRKRRNSEYYPKERSTGFPVSLDDCLGPSVPKKGRRTRQEIIDAQVQEFMKKQAEAMEKIISQAKIAPPIPKVPRRPRMKIVNQEFYQVLNIAYASEKQQNTFKCHSQWCKYKNKDSSHFLRHLKSCHVPDPTIKSHSYCVTCDSKIDAKTLEEEFQHMMLHAENLVKLEDLIQILDSKENKSEITPEMKSIEKEEKINCNSEIIINTEEVSNRYDDIELKLIEMFDDAPKSEKIQIINVVTLPSIDMLENIDELEANFETNSEKDRDNYIARNIMEETNEIKISEAKYKPHLNNTSECANFVLMKEDVVKEAQFEILNSVNRTEIDKNGKLTDIENNEKISTGSHNEETRAPSKNEDETLIDKLEKSKDDHSVMRCALSVSEPSKAPQMFKRSLSVVRHLSKQTESKIYEHNKFQNAKTLESEFIDQLIVNEKSAMQHRTFSPRVSIDETKSPPHAHIMKQRDSFSMYEVSVSKLAPNSVTNTNQDNAKDQIEVKTLMAKVSPCRTSASLSPCDHLQHCTPSQLMPWMDERLLRVNWKYEICSRKMMQKNSLVALFKCMDSFCSFTTNDAELFLNHLNCHHTDLRPSDQFYLYCSYCAFKSNTDVKMLVHHINNCHSRDIFQCSGCFYRSREKETCFHHIQKTHKTISTKILQCPGPQQSERDRKLVMERLKKKRYANVAPIRCKCELKLKVLLLQIKNHFIHIVFILLHKTGFIHQLCKF